MIFLTSISSFFFQLLFHVADSFFSFTEMASSFSKRHLALLAERKKAISNITLNPAVAVEKASLIAIPASSGDATATTPLVDTSTEAPVTLSKKDDKGKGKKIVSSGPKGKRHHKGGEVESQRKKATQSPRLATIAEFDETMTLIIHTTETSKAAEDSHGPSNHPWTREGFKLPQSRRDLFKLSQEIQMATLLLTNLMLSDSKIGKFFCEAVLSRDMDSDTYAYARSHSIGAEDTIGQISAHLSLVIAPLYPSLSFFLKLSD